MPDHGIHARGAGRSPVLRAFLLCAFIFATAFVHAADQAPVKHIPLWRVASGESTVYLLGSVHVAKPDIYPLNDYIEEAFSRADRLVVEVDISKVQQATLQKKVMTLGMLPAGRTLRAELDPEVARKLEEKLQSLKMPVSSFDRMRPWLVYVVLAELDMSRMGYDPANGVDLHFLTQAGGREVIELETADFQLDLLARFTDEDQRQLLQEYLDEPAADAETRKLFDAWYVGDMEALSALVSEEMGGSGIEADLEDELLRKRDAGMAQKIKDLLSKPGVTFVVVGAAHLCGEGSVVDLLTRDGYPVEIVR